MCVAYANAPYVHLWAAGAAARWAVLLAVLLAFVLALLGLTTPNPTQVGSESLLARSDEPAVGVLRITRHPFLCGVALWAFAHLAANGDVASLLFFGALAVLATLGPLSIDHKKARLGVPGWEGYAAVTSVLPFTAIAQGRNRLVLRELGAWRLALGAAVYVLVLGAHAAVFGASPLPF